MTDAAYLFAGLLLLTGLMTSISIWAPRRVLVRVSAVLVAALFVPVSYASLSDLLSRPKPVELEWMKKTVPEATVLGSSINEGTAIYIWLQMNDQNEPRAYALPWNRDLAQQLQNAQRAAEANGSGVRMRLPFERSFDDREPKFYAMPQPALPPKGDEPEQATPATVYRHPSADA